MGGTPVVTMRVRRAAGGRKLRSVRLALPSQLRVNGRRAAAGVTVRAGTRKLSRRSWTLSRSGVLTVRRPRSAAASSITVTLRSGVVRAATRLRSLAVRKRTLPRLTFSVRVVDAKSRKYNYRLRVRPSR